MADRNGRELGYAALSTLTSLPKPGTNFVYAGPVVSGATLGAWKHVPLSPEALAAKALWHRERWEEPLPYRPGRPTVTETESALTTLQSGNPPPGPPETKPTPPSSAPSPNASRDCSIVSSNCLRGTLTRSRSFSGRSATRSGSGCRAKATASSRRSCDDVSLTKSSSSPRSPPTGARRICDARALRHRHLPGEHRPSRGPARSNNSSTPSPRVLPHENHRHRNPRLPRAMRNWIFVKVVTDQPGSSAGERRPSSGTPAVSSGRLRTFPPSSSARIRPGSNTSGR